jgi:hypothetical protein
MGDFTFLDDQWYAASVANQEAYRLPHNYQRLISVYVMNGTTKYIPVEVPNKSKFDYLSAVSSTSSYPQYFNIFSDYIFFYPLPSDTSWGIYLNYKKTSKEMSADDYSTGTVSLTANSRTVTGSGTTFTSSMVGRFLKAPDGLWYEISGYTSATSITLAKTYEGSTVSGATYTIGELPIIPDGFQELLLYKPLMHYFMQKGEEQRSIFYKNLYEAGMKDLKSRFQSYTTSQVIERTGSFVDPNDYPLNLHE